MTNNKTESEYAPVDPISEPIKRITDYTEEKRLPRITEHLVYDVYPIGDELTINGYETIGSDSDEWVKIKIASDAMNQYEIITNSPTIIQKLGKVQTFPVLAKFVSRKVRNKFRYDIE